MGACQHRPPPLQHRCTLRSHHQLITSPLQQLLHPADPLRVQMCAVCNNVLDEYHPASKKHMKRMVEMQDRAWRESEYGKETIRSRRKQTYMKHAG